MGNKKYKVILVDMSGVRVQNQKLMDLGLTLPGFVERSRVIASLPSLGLLTLAAYTPPNWEVVYKEIDSISDAEIQALADADIVAFSSLTARINETYRLSSYLREQGICTVIGGLHASAMPDEASAFCNSVIQGEGENIWPILLRDFEHGKLKHIYSSLKDATLACHFENSKIPKYELLDISKYNRLTLQTTRGCPLHCSFCAASRTISAYKKKSITQVEAELNAILKLWPRPFIELADDNTFVDKKWSAELLKLFSKYKLKWFTETDISVAYNEELLGLLKDSNCVQLLIGFEAASQKALSGLDRNNWKYKQFDNYYRAIDKIQSYGISVNGCFILGFDTDTLQTFSDTENFIRNSNLSEVQITILTPFPNTQLYHQLKKENRLLADNFWENCTLFDVTFEPRNMSPMELESGFQNLMQAVYHPEAVKKRKEKFRQTMRNKFEEPIYESF